MERELVVGVGVGVRVGVGLLRFVLFPERRLRAGHDALNVRVDGAVTRYSVGSSHFGFFAPYDLFLLPFLSGLLFFALEARGAGSVDHGFRAGAGPVYLLEIAGR